MPVLLNEKGVTARRTAYDAIMDTVEWKAAKNHLDAQGAPYPREYKHEAARHVVNCLWSDINDTDLRLRLNGKTPIFIVIPSTTGYNVLPIELARRVQSRIGGELLYGEQISEAAHTVPMKSVPGGQRPYTKRKYVIAEPPSLRQLTESKGVVVVEDVLSSGASAKAFCNALADAGIPVTTVIGLLGDSRLEAEPQLLSKLQKRFRDTGIDINARQVARIMSRGQILSLIDNINAVTGGTEDEYARIADELRRVYNL